MKYVYFLLAAFVILIQSCTIQKRQHLPGYHIEWNTRDSHSEAQKLNSRESESSAENTCAAVAEAAPVSRVETAAITQEDAKVAPVAAAAATAKQQPIKETGVKHDEPGKTRKLTFPSIIHSPAKMLFGGLYPDEKTRTDGMSIAAMICGILSFFVPVVGLVLAILAIVFGGIGIGRTNRNPELKGRGMAITGLILGILGLLFVVFFLIIASLSFGIAF